MKGCGWQWPQPFLHQAGMVTGIFDSSIWEIGSAGYIWTYGYMQRPPETETDRWMDRTEGLKTGGTGRISEKIGWGFGWEGG